MATEALSGNERRLLGALHVLAKDEGKVTVSHADLATALGWKRPRSVRQCAIVLERRGLIRIHNNSTLGYHRANTFAVLPMGHEMAGLDRVSAAA